jgi:pimeloyl-ACP methyl ester carboxylesterase
MRVHTLLVHGDEDHSFITPTNDFLAATLPNCRRVVLSMTGHLVHIEEQSRIVVELRKQVKGT